MLCKNASSEVESSETSETFHPTPFFFSLKVGGKSDEKNSNYKWYLLLSQIQNAALEHKEPLHFLLCQPEGLYRDFNKLWSEFKGSNNSLLEMQKHVLAQRSILLHKHVCLICLRSLSMFISGCKQIIKG